MTIKINVMPLARKAHESMMKEGRGMHLWGLGRRFERSGILRPICCACCRS